MKSKRLEKQFYTGAAFGLAGGVFGNLFVNAMYRWIDGEPRGSNFLTFLIGLTGLSAIFYKLFKKMKNQ
ncbi:MAG: hypothetical protein ABH864_01275 [archaeon]